jgi:hypothetical protein
MVNFFQLGLALGTQYSKDQIKTATTVKMSSVQINLPVNLGDK